MSLNTYQMLAQSLAIVHKISRLAELTEISKSTLTLIAKGRGTYQGCLSTQARLSAFLTRHTQVGRPFKKEENTNARRNQKVEIGGAT